MEIDEIEPKKFLRNNEYDFFLSEYFVNGDIYPLPVLSGENIVWGHSVLRNAAEKGFETVYCRRINGVPESNLITALELENRKDSYSWAEKENLLNFINKNSVDKNKLEINRLVQSEGSFISHTENYVLLPEEMKILVNNNTIDIKTAKKALGIPCGIFKKCVPLIKKITYSRRRLFIDYVSEILKKGFLSRDDVSVMIDNASLQDDPFDYVSLQRYPHLRNMENSFHEYTERNLKGSGIMLKAPPWFEGNSFSVSFSFSSDKQLGRIIEKLDNIRKTSDEIFRLL